MATTLVDVLQSDAFNMVSLTNKINHFEQVPAVVRNLNLFESMPVKTTIAMIDEDYETLSLIASSPRGGPHTPMAARDRGKTRAIVIPHFESIETVNAASVQDLRELGTTNLATVDMIVNRRLKSLSNKLDVTEEYLMLNALKGIILDSDMSTTLVNLFTEFGVSQQTEVDFDLDNATPASGALASVCMDVQETIYDALGNSLASGIVALCGADFFKNLVAHSEIRTSFERYRDNEFARDAHFSSAVTYEGITFIPYRGKLGGTAFVHTDKCHMFPIGVPNLYQIHYAPANTFQAVNSFGVPRYVFTSMDSTAQKEIYLHGQMNPLPLVTKPRVLVQGKRT
jgi:hypothetical protein